MRRPAAIRRRIDLALERTRERGMAVRAIYLSGLDLVLLGKTTKGAVGHYAGHEVRVGGRSAVYSAHGVKVAIPVRAP